MRKTAITLAILLTLTACGNNKMASVSPSNTPTQSSSKNYVVPSSCELSGVNDAFAKIIPPSKYIPTKWKPAAGTDLYEAINAGGIACSYGDQEAEVGGTVIWALNRDGLWDKRVAQWIKDGMVKVDIPGIDETVAYKLPDGSTAADGLPAWRINLLVGDMWIQLGAGFIQSWNEATPIIKAAIAAAN